jgi:hypothetical protein
MFSCTCCELPRHFEYAKSLYRHQRKYDSSYVDPALRRVAAYEVNPRHCECCGTKIDYEDWVTGRKDRFCSRSCSAKINNNRAGTGKTVSPCLHCGQEGLRTPQNKFCSNACQQEHVYETVTVPAILAGEVKTRVTIKRYLVKARGHACEVCKTTTWMEQPVPIELDHIDGNAGDNSLANLRLICPNCHAQTPTAKGKNKGFGRKARGLLRGG